MTAKSLDSFTYFYVPYLALHAIIIFAIATARVHPLTWASTVSDPVSPSDTQGHSPTWVSIVSIPSCQLTNPSSLYFRFRFLLCAHLPTDPTPLSFPKVLHGGPNLFLCFLLASPLLPPMPYSFVLCPPCTYLK